MMSLLRLAFDVVADDSAPVGLRLVACSALLRAMEEGLDVPLGSHIAVWRLLLKSGASAPHRHQLLHADVAADAVRVLLDRETSDAERDLALGVLKDSNLDSVTEQQLAGVVDRALDEGRARQAGYLIENVHEQIGLSVEFLTTVRDRLASANVPAVRAVTLDVARLLPVLDGAFAAARFGDPSPLVRAAVAQMLEGLDNEAEVTEAINLIRDQLKIETHRSVIAACLGALGSLVRAGARRSRMSAQTQNDA